MGSPGRCFEPRSGLGKAVDGLEAMAEELATQVDGEPILLQGSTDYTVMDTCSEERVELEVEFRMSLPEGLDSLTFHFDYMDVVEWTPAENEFTLVDLPLQQTELGSIVQHDTGYRPDENKRRIETLTKKGDDERAVCLFMKERGKRSEDDAVFVGEFDFDYVDLSRYDAGWEPRLYDKKLDPGRTFQPVSSRTQWSKEDDVDGTTEFGIVRYLYQLPPLQSALLTRNGLTLETKAWLKWASGKTSEHSITLEWLRLV